MHNREIAFEVVLHLYKQCKHHKKTRFMYINLFILKACRMCTASWIISLHGNVSNSEIIKTKKCLNSDRFGIIEFWYWQWSGATNVIYNRFTAKDGNGGVAAADVTVNLCNCSGQGQCLFGLLADGYALKQTFRIVQCNCTIGWEGQ